MWSFIKWTFSLPQTDLQEPNTTEEGQAAVATPKETSKETPEETPMEEEAPEKEVPETEAPEKEEEDGAIDDDDDDPSTSDFHGFEDCAGDRSGPTVLSPDTGIVDGCGATFSMEDLPSTPEPSEDDEAEVVTATADLFKVEMGEGLAEALRKLCSQQQQFALPPSPVSNESEGTSY